MEQEYKTEWDKQHFGDHNPYDELPELRIYTYSLGDILKNKDYITFEDKAFNFHEFFAYLQAIIARIMLICRKDLMLETLCMKMTFGRF